MLGTMLYGPRDVRFEAREIPTIEQPTNVLIRIAATCVCGSDLWPYRGLQAASGPTPMGHEYCGVVEKVGDAVAATKQGSSSSAPSSHPTTPARTAVRTEKEFYGAINLAVPTARFTPGREFEYREALRRTANVIAKEASREL